MTARAWTPALLTGICCASLFCLFSLLVGQGYLRWADESVLSFFQAAISRRFDVFFSFFSIVGTFEFTFVLLVVVLLVKATRKNTMFIIFGFGTMTLVEKIIKNFLNQPIPPQAINRYTFPINIPTMRDVSNFAYPSGHLARTAFLFVIFWYLSGSLKNHTLARALLILVILVMSISRIYLAEHWPTDVLGGVLFGSAFALFSWVGSQFIFRKTT